MMINKNRFRVSNDKKVLHKIGKHWVTVSALTLALLGGGALAGSITTHAASNQPQTQAPASATPKGIMKTASALHANMLNNAQKPASFASAKSSVASQPSSSVSSKASSSNDAMNTLTFGTPAQQKRGWNFVQHGINHNDYDKTATKPKFNSAYEQYLKDNPQLAHAYSDNTDIQANNDKPNEPKHMLGSDAPSYRDGSDDSGTVDGLNYVEHPNYNVEITGGTATSDLSSLFDWTSNGIVSIDSDRNPCVKSVTFDNDVDLSHVTNMSGMFSGMSALQSIDFGNKFDTSHVTNMSGMFADDYSLRNIDLSHFNTSNVTNMGGMFSGMSALQSLNFPESFSTNSISQNGLNSFIYDNTNLKSIKLPDNFNTNGNGAVADVDMIYQDPNLQQINIPPKAKITFLLLGTPTSKWYKVIPGTNYTSNNPFNALKETNAVVMPTGIWTRTPNPAPSSDTAIIQYQNGNQNVGGPITLPKQSFGKAVSVSSLNDVPNGYQLVNPSQQITYNGNTYNVPVDVKDDTDTVAFYTQRGKDNVLVSNSTKVSGKDGTKVGIGKYVPQGYSLPAGASSDITLTANPVDRVKIVDDHTGNEATNPYVPVPVKPLSDSATVNFVVSDNGATTDGTALKTVKKSGNDYRATDAGNNDFNYSDSMMPVGYHMLPNQPKNYPYNNGSYTVKIIGNMHNGGQKDENPSNTKPTTKSDQSDIVAVHENEYSGGNYIRTVTQYVAESGRTGEKYTVNANKFVPNGYQVEGDNTNDKLQYGVFNASGVSRPDITFDYDALKGTDIDVKYINQNSDTVGSGTITGLVDKTGNIYSDAPMPKGYHFVNATNNGKEINGANDSSTPYTITTNGQNVVITVAGNPVGPHAPVNPKHPTLPSDNPTNPTQPSDVNPSHTNTPADPQDNDDTFYININDYGYDKSNGKLDKLVRSYQKRETLNGQVGNNFYIDPDTFTTNGYSEMQGDSKYTGSFGPNGLLTGDGKNPANSVTWNYQANPQTASVNYQNQNGKAIDMNGNIVNDPSEQTINGYTDEKVSDITSQTHLPSGYSEISNGNYSYQFASPTSKTGNRPQTYKLQGNPVSTTANLTLVYKEDNSKGTGKVDSQKTIQIPVTGHVGDTVEVADPFNYEQDNFDDNNVAWFYQFKPSGNSLSKTFTYYAPQAGSLTIGYYDTNTGHEVGSDKTYTASDMENNYGVDWYAGNTITLGYDTSKDNSTINILKAPAGYQFDNDTSANQHNYNLHNNKIVVTLVPQELTQNHQGMFLHVGLMMMAKPNKPASNANKPAGSANVKPSSSASAKPSSASVAPSSSASVAPSSTSVVPSSASSVVPSSASSVAPSSAAQSTSTSYVEPSGNTPEPVSASTSAAPVQKPNVTPATPAQQPSDITPVKPTTPTVHKHTTPSESAKPVTKPSDKIVNKNVSGKTETKPATEVGRRAAKVQRAAESHMANVGNMMAQPTVHAADIHASHVNAGSVQHQSTQHKLPQTNEAKAAGLMGASAIMAALGLAGADVDRKRRHD